MMCYLINIHELKVKKIIVSSIEIEITEQQTCYTSIAETDGQTYHTSLYIIYPEL